MPSDYSTVGNPFQSSFQDLVSSSVKPLKTLVSRPISAVKQEIITAQEAIKEKQEQLKLFKSSTDDFPNLAGGLNNKTREYLEAHRFYKLEPTDSDLKEKTIKLIHDDSKDIHAKYPLNLNANEDYLYPISLLQKPVITRPFFRESERAHDINLRKEIRKEIKNDRQEFIPLKQEVRAYVESNIKDGSFMERYVERSSAKALTDTYPNKKDRDAVIRELFLETTVNHILKTVAPDTKLVKLWKNAPQENNMGSFRTATNRLLHPSYEEQRDFRLKPELRELIDKYFPFERLKLKPEFLPREQGLKHSLRLYLNNLKNYEPHLYNFCLNADDILR